MKNVIVPILALLTTTSIFATQNLSIVHTEEPKKITFTENKGQVSDQHHITRNDVLFTGCTNNMAFHLRKNGISYQLCEIKESLDTAFNKHSKNSTKTESVDMYRVDINWLDINSDFTIERENAVKGYNNYYLASCPSGIHKVRSYEEVTYKNIYNKIDLHYYSKGSTLKYDYIVNPGSDYKRIRLQVNGAQKIVLRNDGSISMGTPFGNIIDEAPVVFQKGKKLNSRWELKDNILSFGVDNYNPDETMIIDPGVLAYGTYYGGGYNDYGFATSNDLHGNFFLAGETSSNTGTVIATSGGYQNSYAGGLDGFIVKFNTDGTRAWSTYYGGSDNDHIYACKTDSSSVYIAGSSESWTTTGLTTPGCHQGAFGGGPGDGLLVKLDSTGARLWATFYGNNGDDNIYSCSVDKLGNIIIIGKTGSTSSIATNGAFQTAPGGSGDAYIAKFNKNGVRQWGTYFGGTGWEFPMGCSSDSFGNIYLSGYTYSSDLPVLNAHQSIYGGGPPDAFLAKFSPSGICRWSTYYGGADGEFGFTCFNDNFNNVYLGGEAYTQGNSSIPTIGCHQPTFGGATDGFIAKFDSSGIRQWGTYYGGTGSDAIKAGATDRFGNLYIGGRTGSTNSVSIATPGSHKTSALTGDAFLVKFNPAGVRQWGTYYGGEYATDYGTSICLDTIGNIFLTGYTQSKDSTYVVTVGCYQPSHAGGTDAFIAKFTDTGIIGFYENEVQEEIIEVYPNPTSGIVMLKGLFNENYKYEVYSTLGQQVSKGSIGSRAETLNLNNLSNGWYFIKIFNGGHQYFSKIIKE